MKAFIHLIKVVLVGVFLMTSRIIGVYCFASSIAMPTGKKYEGGLKVKADASYETMPLFVKAGSIIPFGPFIQYSTEPEDPIELRIYPGTDGEFTLYEDEKR